MVVCVLLCTISVVFTLIFVLMSFVVPKSLSQLRSGDCELTGDLSGGGLSDGLVSQRSSGSMLTQVNRATRTSV